MWKGRPLCQRVCQSLQETGKLSNLGAKGWASEGNPREASDLNTLINVNAAMSFFSIQGKLFNKQISFLVDTGSAVSLLHSTIWKQSKPPGISLSPWSENFLVGVNGTSLHICGTANITITILNQTFPLQVAIIDNLTTPVILRLDFLEANQCSLNIGERLLYIPNCKSPIPVCDNNQCATSASQPILATLLSTQRIPPFSEVETLAYVSADDIKEPHLLEPFSPNSAVFVARALVNPTNRTIPIRLLNPSDETITVYKNTKVAELEPIASFPSTVAATTADLNQDQCKPEKLKQDLWNMVQNSDTELNDTQ